MATATKTTAVNLTLNEAEVEALYVMANSATDKDDATPQEWAIFNAVCEIR